jgi:DAACS family dicarboxylate/amino acid:cation (Na+ or H+) symporter
MTDPVASEAARPARFPIHAQIGVAMGLGVLAGPLLGREAVELGEIGKLVIQLIKAAAAPLLFFSIVHAILKTEIQRRSAARLFFWAAFNACIALSIGLALSNLFKPGRTLAHFVKPNAAALTAYAEKKLELIPTLSSFVPTSLVTPFAENLVLTIVLIALLFGFGLRRARSEQLAQGSQAFRSLEDGVETLLRVMELVLAWIIKLVPFAVFGVVAKAMAEHGYGPLKGLVVYLVIGLSGLALHILFTYQALLVFVARMPLSRFWREAKEPVVYAAGANSSLATLPVTLRALDRLGVSRSSSALGACVGTNFNNDGIILYEGMAVLFVAQASGLDLSFSQQLLAAAACLVAAMGVAGVPEAGFVSLALVLNTVALPLELLPLLLTVDWVIARGRSVTNVLSDMLLSILLDRKQQRAPLSSDAPLLEAQSAPSSASIRE